MGAGGRRTSEPRVRAWGEAFPHVPGMAGCPYPHSLGKLRLKVDDTLRATQPDSNQVRIRPGDDPAASPTPSGAARQPQVNREGFSSAVGGGDIVGLSAGVRGLQDGRLRA